MLHFIPAWYQQGQWCENEQKWYIRRMHTEFDDTVKQIQLFQRNSAYPYQILLLAFSPNFRHFLHRQGVYHAPYWSCFDAMQEVKRERAAVLSYHNISWPPHVEFLYTPFAAIAMLQGKKYAQIEFGEDGNPIQIDLFENGKICRRNLYDDRGFVSSTILFQEEKPVRQDYLCENGKWKLRCYPEDGHVEINPKSPEYFLSYQGYEKRKKFFRQSYDSMEQVIREVLASYLRMTEEGDLFCAAMDGHHTGLLREALQGRKTILSFFGNRYLPEEHPEAEEMMERAAWLITDSRENAGRILNRGKGLEQKITDISPYDSRVDFGVSEQLNVQKILVPVDGMEEEAFKGVVRALGMYLPKNANARVHLFTRRADYGRKEQLLEQTRRYLQAAGFPQGWAARENDGQFYAENDLEEKESQPVLFRVEQCVDELSVSKCMREQRLLMDMRPVPELYLQITALSMGIPQVVRTRTQFVRQGRNGIILQEMRKIPSVLRYYLDSLENWNYAKVCSYTLGKRYTTTVLMEKWKEVIEAIG